MVEDEASVRSGRRWEWGWRILPDPLAMKVVAGDSESRPLIGTQFPATR